MKRNNSVRQEPPNLAMVAGDRFALSKPFDNSFTDCRV